MTGVKIACHDAIATRPMEITTIHSRGRSRGVSTRFLTSLYRQLARPGLQPKAERRSKIGRNLLTGYCTCKLTSGGKRTFFPLPAASSFLSPAAVTTLPAARELPDNRAGRIIVQRSYQSEAANNSSDRRACGMDAGNHCQWENHRD